MQTLNFHYASTSALRTEFFYSNKAIVEYCEINIVTYSYNIVIKVLLNCNI